MDGRDGGAHLPIVTLAWYAAYGSNTDEARLRCYLDGCSTPTEPLDRRPYAIDLPLYFSGDGSTRWGAGGVAFVDSARDATPSTLVRAWLLPVATIAEIGAQENGLPLDRANLDLAALDLAALDLAAFPGRRYDSWIHCGAIDGIPVVTLTSSKRLPSNPPGPRYVGIVARGLRLTHEMTREAVASYLAPRTNLPIATLMEWQEEGHGYSGAND